MNRRGPIVVAIILTTIFCLFIHWCDVKAEPEYKPAPVTTKEQVEEEVLGVEYTTEEYRKELQDVTTLACVEPLYMTFEEIPLERDYQVKVQKLCSKYDVDYALILAIMSVETGGTFNTKVDPERSHVGAMQISPYWFEKKAAELNLDIYDELESIELGIIYIRELLVKHDGEPALAVTEYNTGKGTTTNKYANAVMSLRDEYDLLINKED